MQKHNICGAYLDPILGVVALDLEGPNGPGFYAFDPETAERILVRPVEYQTPDDELVTLDLDGPEGPGFYRYDPETGESIFIRDMNNADVIGYSEAIRDFFNFDDIVNQIDSSELEIQTTWTYDSNIAA